MRVLNDVPELLRGRKAGDRVRILVARYNRTREIEVVLGTKMERSFAIRPAENPPPLASAILKDVLQ